MTKSKEIPAKGKEVPWPEQLLRRELRAQAKNIAALAARLEQSEDFPTETPKCLCRLLHAIADALACHLDNAPTSDLSATTRLLRYIGEDLRYVERSRIANTPWSMVEAAERFFKHHVGEENQFILRPQWSFNYKISEEFVVVYRNMLETLDWLRSDALTRELSPTSRLYCISFPRVQRANVLLHTNWGHELGHIIAARWRKDHFHTFWEQLSPSVKRAIDDEINNANVSGGRKQKQRQANIFQQQEESNREKDALNIAEHGLIELIADAVGVHLLGPSAIMAAFEMAVRGDLDEGPIETYDHYPPWRYRLRFMIRSCQEDLDAIKTHKEYRHFYDHLLKVQDLTKSDSDMTVVRRQTLTKLPYEAITSQWDSIRTQALTYLAHSSTPYRLSARIDNITQLVKRLQNEMPPNEIGQWPDAVPASFEDILSAGWVRKTQLDTQSHINADRDREKLYRLVLKGIESSQIHQEFGPRLAAEEATSK